MRGTRILFAWTIVIGISLMLGCSNRIANAEGTVLAEYEIGGKQKITLEELEQEIAELPKYKQRKYEDREGKAEYLELMAESRIILEEAKKLKLDEDPEILKKVEEYLHQLMVEKITEMEVDNKIKPVTEEDKRAYYEEHKEEYVEPEQVRLTCIMSEEDEEQANEWYKQIQEGKDIAELAKELSEMGKNVGPGARTGDTGFFTQKAFPAAQAFNDAAFALKVGEMYPGVFALDVQGTNYYAIFRLEERKAERQKEFDEEDVQKDIQRKLEKANKKERMDTWVAGMRQNAKLKLYPELIPAPPEEEPSEVDTGGSDTKSSEMKGSETKESEGKKAEMKESDTKGSDTKNNDTKGSDTKSNEMKGSETKGSESK